MFRFTVALRFLFIVSFFLLVIAGLASAAPCTLNPTNPSVTICTPGANSSVTSPVSLLAGSTDSSTVIAMAIYVDNVLISKVNGSQISTSANFAVGQHSLVAQLWDNAGRVIKQSENFTVVASAPAPTVSFSSNPASIASGGNATLTWSTTNATSVSIDNGVGAVPTSGSTVVFPTATTTYTITATGSGGTATDKATVTVGSSGGTCNPGTAPSVTICSPINGSTVPSPVHVVAVPSSNTGVVSMAVYFDNVLVYNVAGNKVDTLINAAAGAHYVVVQFWDNNGAVPAKAAENITVSGTSTQPTATLSANPASITSGAASTLTWSTTNATSVTIDNGVGTVATSGSVSVAPTQTTTYTLTATGSGGTVTAQATVTVSASSSCTPATGPPSVTICSPVNGSTVPSPVHVLAAPNSTTGVVAMAVYLDSTLVYKANVNKVDTMVNAAAGAHNVVVQFWDNSGNVPAKASENITVGSGRTGAFNITPSVATVYPNGTQSFAANQNGTAISVNWYVDGVEFGNSSVGTISAGGLYTAPAAAGAHQIKAVSTANTSQSATAVVNVVDSTENMTTSHNDPARTGANLKEALLNPGNVIPSRFGKLGSYGVDGQVYAQPLYVSNLGIGGGAHNVVYVATEHDSVYAFDADYKRTAPYWSVSLIPAGASPAASSDVEGISPEIGVTGTPVIDRANNAIYLVSMINVSGAGNEFWLHALDLGTGAEKFGGPKRVNPTVNGTGFGSVNGVVPLEPGCYQRAGLALGSGNIYVSFGHCSHGWVAAYNETTLAQSAVFNSSANGKGAAIWMGGGAPALDPSNNLYFETGVDADSTTNSGYSDSFIKLSPSLTLLDYFMLSNNAYLTTNDADLGSGAPVVLPDNTSAFPHELVGAGKDGRIFLVNRDNMGQFNAGGDRIVQAVQSGVQQFDNFFDQPAYWNGNLYYHAENDVLRQFKWTSGLLSTSPSFTGTVTYGVHGATPSVSANGASNGIVWELQVDGQPTGPAVLHAYDATNVSHELYNSNMNASDKAGPAVKFTVPTIVNGKVYVPAGHELDIFGLLR